MDARRISRRACVNRVAVLLVSLSLLSISSIQGWSAGARTQNFIVSARDVAFAQQVAAAAEQYRAELALQWLGQELPPWPQPCPISVQDGQQLGAGGATSFTFDRGYPSGWTMSIQGTRERILDSVLPHEITHTVFATHFGAPVPRWADEGACTTVEHPHERAKQHQLLLQFLSTGRGIPFNKMFRMTEYPHDIMPLYSQGHSVAQYLIAQGGQRHFVDFVGRGMRSRNWDAAVDEFYGYRDLSDLQLTWVDWVKRGCPDVQPRHEELAANTPSHDGVIQLAQADGPSHPGKFAQPAADAWRSRQSASEPRAELASTGGGSWYARQRDTASENRQTGFDPPSVAATRSVARNQEYQQTREQVLQWEAPAQRMAQEPPPATRYSSAGDPLWR